MKVLTEEEQVQQGAFLWGATTADSQVGLGLSCGLWILMMVQWSRYANLQCSFSPVSAEKSGCVQICNLCCGSTSPPFFFLMYSHPITPTVSFASQSLRLRFSPPYLSQFVVLLLYTPPSVCLFLNCSRAFRTPTPDFHLIHLCLSPAHS